MKKVSSLRPSLPITHMSKHTQHHTHTHGQNICYFSESLCSSPKEKKMVLFLTVGMSLCRSEEVMLIVMSIVTTCNMFTKEDPGWDSHPTGLASGVCFYCSQQYNISSLVTSMSVFLVFHLFRLT